MIAPSQKAASPATTIAAESKAFPSMERVSMGTTRSIP